MTNEHYLTFSDENKSHFKPTEPVKIKLDIKNIPLVQIKIYDISLVNYYIKNGKELDLGIDLQGFLPSYEKAFSNSEPPIVKHSKVFDFDYIT